MCLLGEVGNLSWGIWLVFRLHYCKNFSIAWGGERVLLGTIQSDWSLFLTHRQDNSWNWHWWRRWQQMEDWNLKEPWEVTSSVPASWIKTQFRTGKKELFSCYALRMPNGWISNNNWPESSCQPGIVWIPVHAVEEEIVLCLNIIESCILIYQLPSYSLSWKNIGKRQYHLSAVIARVIITNHHLSRMQLIFDTIQALLIFILFSFFIIL